MNAAVPPAFWASATACPAASAGSAAGRARPRACAAAATCSRPGTPPPSGSALPSCRLEESVKDFNWGFYILPILTLTFSEHVNSERQRRIQILTFLVFLRHLYSFRS